jgi:hypothetical protein
MRLMQRRRFLDDAQAQPLRRQRALTSWQRGTGVADSFGGHGNDTLHGGRIAD